MLPMTYRGRFLALFAGAACLAWAADGPPLPRIHFTITDDDWLGGPGNWNSTNWSTGSSPGAGNNAVINNSSPAAVVQLNISPTINNLTIGSTSVLNFQNATVLTVNGSTITNSNGAGTGGLVINATGADTGLMIGANVTLTGGGTMTLTNNGCCNEILGAVCSDVLTNLNNINPGLRLYR